ncbi:ABC transporter permease [Terrilactibacillus sp. S3-3]|nr:ABC transporter permease [Terrilactibacillus sp. S3-3]
MFFFLLPIEAELDEYFRKSKMYSFLIQSAWLAALLIVISPLYFRSVDSSTGAYLLLAGAAFAAKAWNIDCHWCEQYIDERLPLKCLRGALSFLFIYAAASERSFLLLIVCCAVMLATSFFLFHRQAKVGLLKWDLLLEMENKQVMHFLRFANLFTDVPVLKRKVHPRRWLNGLVKIRSFEPESVFKQLFLKTFLRAGDYFGIYIRLTVVGAVGVFFLKNGYYTVFIIAAVVYLTGLQLIPLWKHPLPQALAGLYPIAEQVKQRNFIHILFRLLIAETVVLSAAGGIAVRSSIGFLLFLAAGTVVSALVVYGYVKRKIAAVHSLSV